MFLNTHTTHFPSWLVEHSRADLVIVLGCSLRVAPANELLLRTLAVSHEGTCVLLQYILQ